MKKTGTTLSLAAALMLLCITALSAQTTRPIVTDIAAVPRSATRVTISWKLPAQAAIKSLLVFRSNRPFASRTQLDENAPIAKLKSDSVSYTDTLKNYKEYYYAVIALLSDGTRYDIILPSINATVNGVRVERVISKQQTPAQTESAKEKLYADGEMRELPLPYLDLIANQDKKAVVFSSAVYDAGKTLAGKYMKHEIVPLDPYVFEADMVSPTGGDDYFLFEILRTDFVRKKYGDCTADLQKFLSVNRSASVTKRATFYLGESCYFCGDYPNALTSFLQVEDDYPVISKKWIESTLDLYSIPSKCF